MLGRVVPLPAGDLGPADEPDVRAGYRGVRCIDAADVRWQVEQAHCDGSTPYGFDVPAIVAEIIHTYGLVNVCHSLASVDYSTLVVRHHRE